MTEPGRSRPLSTGPLSTGLLSAADLDRRPVAEHVGVFEAEHARLERDLRTIDQL